jgi:protein-export membrane protein SecD
MMQNLKFKIIVILAVFLGSLYYLYPTIHLSRLSSEEKKRMSLSDPQGLKDLEERSVKLGLDLQGGMHLVLELDNSKMAMSDKEKVDAIDRALEIIRTRVDQFGVSEPLIQKAGSERIIIELAGIVDTSRARALVQQSAYLEFKLVKPQSEFYDVLKLVDGLVVDNNLVLLPDQSSPASPQEAVKAPTSQEFNPISLFQEEKKEGAVSDTGKARSDSLQARAGKTDTLAGVKSDSLHKDTTGGKALLAESIKTPFSRLFFQEPYLRQTVERRENYLLVPLNNIPLVKEYLSMPQVRSLIARAEAENLVDFSRYKSPSESSDPDTLEVLLGDEDTDVVWQDGIKYKHIYLLKKHPEMTGGFIADANATLGGSYDPKTANKPMVLMKLTPAGADSFETITERFLQRDLSIVLDKVVKFAPRIMTRIPGGNAQIEGVATMDKARDLSIVLRAGALPAPLTIAESRTVGPSLGADSIQKGRLSAILGILLVVVFMLIYYKFGGLVADFALVFNMIITLAVLAGFNATLTLPGIAGLILTIGMAVDANVLIFERIREELRSGKSLRAAIDAGYDRAFTTILDSNLTTFISAVVLFQFGTGPIKGFAVTLSIGLAASMFTAIYVTRVFFNIWTSRKNVKSISL